MDALVGADVPVHGVHLLPGRADTRVVRSGAKLARLAAGRACGRVDLGICRLRRGDGLLARLLRRHGPDRGAGNAARRLLALARHRYDRRRWHARRADPAFYPAHPLRHLRRSPDLEAVRWRNRRRVGDGRALHAGHRPYSDPAPGLRAQNQPPDFRQRPASQPGRDLAGHGPVRHRARRHVRGPLHSNGSWRCRRRGLAAHRLEQAVPVACRGLVGAARNPGDDGLIVPDRHRRQPADPLPDAVRRWRLHL